MNGSRIAPVCMGGLLVLGLAVMDNKTKDAAEKPSAGPRGRQTVGLLDVQYVFNNYPRFTERMSELKGKVQQAEAEMKEEQEAIKDLEAQIKLSTVGTPEHTKLEREITADKAALAASLDSQKKAFLREEARVYHDAYQEILEEIEVHAKEHRIAVVLRANDKQANVGNPQEVLQKLNSQVVWWDKRRDITRTIVERLVERSKSADATGEFPEPGGTKTGEAEERTHEPPARTLSAM